MPRLIEDGRAAYRGYVRLLYLYDLPLPVPLAAPIQILRTARAMAEAGHDVTTAWAGVPDAGKALRFYGVAAHANLHVVPFYNQLSRLMLRRSLAKVTDKFDIVMSRGEAGVAAFAAIADVPNRPAFVYEAHRRVGPTPGWLTGTSQAKAKALEAAAVRGADGLVFISQGVSDALMEAYRPTTSTLVLPSGVAVGDESESPRDLDLLYAGKLERRKGLDLMLEAMAHLPGVTLTLVGDGAGPGLPANVEAVGYVEPSRVRDYFRRAKVGVCPLPAGVSEVSDRFTSPMKILEMMAAGTPVVATDLPSVREILTDGRNALLVPPNDPPALAAAVRNLLDDRELAARLAAQARVDVTPYSWTERGRKLGEFLSAVVEKRVNGQT